MAFEFLCEACGARLRIGDELAGKEVKCPRCSAVVAAKPAEETQAAKSPFAGPAPGPPSTDEVNPYASPAALPEVDATGQPPAAAEAITPGIRGAMSQTRPWVLFLSILGFVGGAFMALAAVGMIFIVLFTQEFFALLPGVTYVVSAVFYFACAYYLFLYGRRIGSFEQSNHAGDLEAALVAQKSFWRLVGILVLVMLAFAGLMVVVALVLPFTMGVNL